MLFYDLSILYYSYLMLPGGFSFFPLILYTLFLITAVGTARYMLAYLLVCLDGGGGGIWGACRLLWLFDAYDTAVMLFGHGRDLGFYDMILYLWEGPAS